MIRASIFNYRDTFWRCVPCKLYKKSQVIIPDLFDLLNVFCEIVNVSQ